MVRSKPTTAPIGDATVGAMRLPVRSLIDARCYSPSPRLLKNGFENMNHVPTAAAISATPSAMPACGTRRRTACAAKTTATTAGKGVSTPIAGGRKPVDEREREPQALRLLDPARRSGNAGAHDRVRRIGGIMPFGHRCNSMPALA